MTHHSHKIALAFVLGLTALAPISAQAGSLSLSLNARTGQEARALNTAIALYALHRDLKSGADIRQIGRNHAAGAVSVRRGQPRDHPSARAQPQCQSDPDGRR